MLLITRENKLLLSFLYFSLSILSGVATQRLVRKSFLSLFFFLSEEEIFFFAVGFTSEFINVLLVKTLESSELS